MLHPSWLLESLKDYVMAEVDHAKWKLSAGPDLEYNRGYRAAENDYEVGPNPTRPDPHSQVEIDGIEVDEGMAGLLQALWSLGLDTEYSCQGHPHLYRATLEGSWNNNDAHIVFGDHEEAFRFYRKSLELLGRVPWGTEGRLTMQAMVPLPPEMAFRAVVGWPPELLEELTELWVGFARQMADDQ